MKRLQNGSWSGKFCLYREPYGKCGQCNTTKYLIRRGIEVSTIAFDATNLNATKTRQRVQDLVQLLSMLNNCNVHGIKEFIIKSPYYLEHNYISKPVGGTPLIIASKLGSAEMVTALVEIGANVHQIDSTSQTSYSGGTVLACCKDWENLDLLLDLDIDINRAEKASARVLRQAVHTGSIPHTVNLVSMGAELNFDAQQSLLRHCLEAFHDVDTLHALHHIGTDFLHVCQNCYDTWNFLTFGSIPLGKQSEVYQRDTALQHLDFYIQNTDVDINAADPEDEGSTALIRATQNSELEMVKMLIEAGADIDRRDNEGRTVLMFACLEGNLDIIKVLLDAKASISLLDKSGRSARNYAEKEPAAQRTLDRMQLKERSRNFINCHSFCRLQFLL